MKTLNLSGNVNGNDLQNAIIENLTEAQIAELAAKKEAQRIKELEDYKEMKRNFLLKQLEALESSESMPSAFETALQKEITLQKEQSIKKEKIDTLELSKIDTLETIKNLESEIYKKAEKLIDQKNNAIRKLEIIDAELSELQKVVVSKKASKKVSDTAAKIKSLHEGSNFYNICKIIEDEKSIKKADLILQAYICKNPSFAGTFADIDKDSKDYKNIAWSISELSKKTSLSFEVIKGDSKDNNIYKFIPIEETKSEETKSE